MMDEFNGVIVIDKPPDVTSAGVVALLKRLLRVRKIGHAGTLDPFATGVLVCCVNRATKLARFLLQGKKKYEAVLRLGTETDTQDATGDVIRTSADTDFSENRLQAVFRKFLGESLQRPPVHSALKHNGVRLYKLARQGKPVQKPERKIQISAIEILNIQSPDIQFETECSAGTYIRALCSDIGAVLGCGAHLKELRRMESSGFNLTEALTLDDVDTLVASGTFGDHIVSMADALRGMPTVTAGSGLKEKIRFGKKLTIKDFPSDGAGLPDGFVGIIDEDKQLCAVLEINNVLNQYKYCCVIEN